MSGKSKSVVIVVCVALVLVCILAGSYNGLQTKDENVDNAWAQVENQLQRRYDLVPNLVAVVKQYSEYEANTLEGIVKLRSDGSVESEQKADAEYRAYINALVENYPDLKANESYQDLMTELAGTENRIAVARKDYNEAVEKLNSSVRKFPMNILASMFGVDKREYFEISDEASQNVDVNSLFSN